MAYTYTQEELYNRALFTLDNNGQSIHIAFEPSEGDSYIMIVFCDNGKNITGYHEHGLWDALFNILSDFDNNRRLDYEIIAI